MLKKLLVIAFLALCAWFVYKKRELILPRKSANELVFWTIQLKPVCEEIIQKNISEFEKKHPEIKVVWVDIPIAEAQKRTLASILSNSPPDLVNLNPDFSMLLAERGALDLFSEEDLKNFHPELVNMLKYKGEIFGIPYYATSSVTLYNEKAYEACVRAEVPETYDELANMAPELSKCSKSSVFTINLNENDTLARILAKYDAFDTQKTVRVFDMFKTMYDKGYIPKDSLTINHREVVEKYMSQNTMFVVVGSNFIKMVEENAKDVYENSYIAPQLTGPEGKYDVSLMNFIIPKKASHRGLAKEFALQLTGHENQLEFAKLTNTLPANKEALEDDYFNICEPSDLMAEARCISKKQLNNLVDKNFGYKNKKAINDTLNRALESYILQNSGIKGVSEAVAVVKALQE